MAETTNPDSGVEQAAPTETSIESSLQQAFGATPTEKKAPETPTEESAPELTDEVTPDDIPDEVEATPQEPGTDAFEIVHNGTQHKLTREDTIRYAQQGFDYTQKTQALAEKAKFVDASLQRVAELEQLAPYVAQDLAQVRAIEAQLKPYQNVDWVALASDPNTVLDYPKYRAQYDQLLQSYQSAQYQLQTKAVALQQGREQLTAQKLQQEFPKLIERIPQWKDPAKYEAGARELKSYLLSQGADASRVDSMSDSLEAQIAWKAMQYDKLVQAKTEKVKQLRTAPAVVKPGAAAAQSQTGKQSFAKALQEVRAQGRKGNHRAQEDLATQMFERAFKK